MLPDRFNWFHTHPRLLLGIIFVGFLLLHCFIFRDVIAAIPDVLHGNASIVREELVPFFDFKTQFWGEGTSALTSSEEVRVNYSFWTAWVRYDPVLPFAIVILTAISAFILFYAFHRLGRYVYKTSLFGMIAAILATTVIHTILLYSKMAHFYVLIIGFSMFALSLSLMCEQLFFKLKLSKKNIAAVSLLILFNPAIHYHVIFYVVTALIMIIHSMFTLIMNRKYFWRYALRSLLYFGALILFSLMPYVVYIYLTSSSSLDNVSTQIPVNYWMIYYASLGLPFIFSLDTAGHLDLLRYGNYLTPIPRFGSTLVMFLIGSLFLFKRWKTLHIVVKVLILTLFMVMLFAMWMTIGYSDNSPYSFHKVFGNVALFFAGMNNAVGPIIASLMGTFINILRFPHRFQFIYFYAAGILFMIALVWLYESFSRRLKTVLAAFFVVLIALFPIIASNDYRTALTSGDLATFVSPYRIPNDLKNIKSMLANESNRKLFILPTLESGREIVQDGKRYSFLDKYLIYYLNKPTLYYGAGANTDNKLASYLVYRAIAYQEPWWQDILANNLGITDIVMPEHAKQRDRGIVYLPGIEAKVKASLTASKKYQKSYSGPDYSLYSLKKARSDSNPLLLDLSWKNALGYLNHTHADQPAYFPLQLQEFLKATGDKQLLTDSPERSFYDVYIATKHGTTIVPNPASLPFNSRYVASSNFTNSALSLSTLYNKNDDYNYLHENIPSLMNLQRPSFVGLTKGSVGLDVKLKIPATGQYRVLLHAASKGDQIKTQLGGTDLTLTKLKTDQGNKDDFIDPTYFYADVNMSQGEGKLTIKNTTQNAVIVDSVTLVPLGDVPTDFDHVTNAFITLTPAQSDGTYKLDIRR